jgi:NAD(P)-dependent dehydrogenase (short-subunit alcohol dehydrogenase family)
MKRDARVAVVTGASSGIGRATAILLDREGWMVFAGVRRQEDADALRKDASALLEPVTLDVRDREQIEELSAKVGERSGGHGLQALVNNAGVGVGGPIEFLSEEGLCLPIEVNLLGPLRMTQALLPALRRGEGRIVNVTSGASHIVMPGTGLYSASKLALDSASALLRVELASFGIPVISVDPGLVRTRLTDQATASYQAGVDAMPPEGRELYRELLPGMEAQARRVNRKGKPPEAVAAAIAMALSDPNVKETYAVGKDARAMRVISKLPARVKKWILSQA